MPCFTLRFNKVFWVLGHKAEKSQMFGNLDAFSSHISSICLSVIGSGDLPQPDPLCTSEDVDGTCFHSVVREE